MIFEYVFTGRVGEVCSLCMSLMVLYFSVSDTTEKKLLINRRRFIGDV